MSLRHLPVNAALCLGQLDTLAKNYLNNSDYKLFQSYMAEAAFYFPIVLSELERIKKCKQNLVLLELGGGIGILSLLLAVSGYRIYCQEPSSVGFSFMSKIYNLTVARYAQSLDSMNFHYSKGLLSSLDDSLSYDYVFSINVFEHINSIPSLLSDLSLTLSPASVIRVICPNSTFPYEPHFGIPILFSKSITFAFFSRKISRLSAYLPGVWTSLNFVSTTSLRREFVRQFPESSHRLGFSLHCDSINHMLHRTDKEFLARQPSALLFLRKFLIRFPCFPLVMRMFARTPIAPYIDMSVHIQCR